MMSVVERKKCVEFGMVDVVEQAHHVCFAALSWCSVEFSEASWQMRADES